MLPRYLLFQFHFLFMSNDIYLKQFYVSLTEAILTFGIAGTFTAHVCKLYCHIIISHE